MKGGGRMNLRKSGIRICREKQHNSGNNGWSAVFLCAVCVSMLSLAWWNAFLSVFLPGVDASWLYRSLIVLAVILTMFDRRLGGWALLPEILCAGGFLWFNRELLRELISYGNVTDLRLTGMLTAAAMVPLMALWVIVFRSGKGRFAAGLLMTAPYIAAACLGYFQDMVPGWLLFLSGVLYFACSSAGEFRAQIPAILVLFAAVTVISVYGGRTLDAGRETEGGFYQTARNTIETELIGKVEQLIYGERRDESERFPQLPEEAAGPEDAEQAEEQESASADGNALAQGENFSPQEESGMDDLKSIGAFVPAEGVLGTVVVQTRPGQTYYEARRIGIEYTGGGWEQGNLSYLGRQQDLSGEELEQYLICPDGLDRLESLCADWDTGSREAVSEQIDEALARAVYDTAPGPAPQDQDFAEYFLFENQRGFCVHFATTAAVIYRMCGYPSRYAEGYAIPPSAFVEREDGRYEARIDGTMGHAWCQVYDEAAGMWVDMEHTPAASGVVPDRENTAGTDTADGAADESLDETVEGQNADAEQGRLGKITSRFLHAMLPFAAAAGSVVLILLIIRLQARIRRKRFARRAGYRKGGTGALILYDAIFRTADLMSKTTEHSERKQRGERKGRRTESITDTRAGRITGHRRRDLFAEQNIERLKTLCPEIPEETWDRVYYAVMETMFGQPGEADAERENWQAVYSVYLDFARIARRSMGTWQKIRYRYIFCLEPL